MGRRGGVWGNERSGQRTVGSGQDGRGAAMGGRGGVRGNKDRRQDEKRNDDGCSAAFTK